MVAPVIPALKRYRDRAHSGCGGHAGVKEAQLRAAALPLEVRDLFRDG